MRAGAKVFLQSDILEVAVAMRNQFEQCGGFDIVSAVHQPGSVFHQEPVDDKQASGADNDYAGGSKVELQEDIWQSTWATAGWLCDNPLGVPTEREVLCRRENKAVYRIYIERVQ